MLLKTAHSYQTKFCYGNTELLLLLLLLCKTELSQFTNLRERFLRPTEWLQQSFHFVILLQWNQFIQRPLVRRATSNLRHLVTTKYLGTLYQLNSHNLTVKQKLWTWCEMLSAICLCPQRYFQHTIFHCDLELWPWCGGIFHGRFIVNLSLNVQWRNFKNWLIISKDNFRSLHVLF